MGKNKCIIFTVKESYLIVLQASLPQVFAHVVQLN